MIPSKQPSILLTGFGSIGRRHMRNLRALGVSDITVYRTGKSTLDTDELDGARVVYDLDEALALGPAATVIANPTALHIPAALAAARAGSHLFFEKPISHTRDGLDDLRQIVHNKQLVVFVGFQFRFHPGLRQVRQWLAAGAVGRVVHVQAHWAEHLPNWHPWEDYRTSYAARCDLGGGVLLTLCHPFDYLRWLFGDVARVIASTGSRGLDIEAEDIADVHLQFASGVMGHVHVDYVARPGGHWLAITGTDGTIRWDNADGVAHLYRAAAESWESVAPPAEFDRNVMFLDEMRHFLACLAGEEQSLCSLHDGIQALEIVLAAHESSRAGAAVTFPEGGYQE